MHSKVFFDEWRQCLREHYLYVVRIGDEGTERTLRQVMKRVHFTDEDLHSFRLEALGESPEDYPYLEEELEATLAAEAAEDLAAALQAEQSAALRQEIQAEIPPPPPVTTSLAEELGIGEEGPTPQEEPDEAPPPLSLKPKPRPEAPPVKQIGLF
jgi:hypothetical protein